MQVEINEHVTLLMLSLAAGVVLALCYDAFRLCRSFFGLGISTRDSPFLSKIKLPLIGERKVRAAGKMKRVARSAAVFAFDITYMLTATTAIVIFLYRTSNGTPRWFSLLGIAVGFFAYMKTVGRLTAHVAAYIFFTVDAALRYLIWAIVTPVRLAARALRRLTVRVYESTVKKAIMKHRRRAEQKRRQRYIEQRLSKILAGIAEAIFGDGTEITETEKNNV